MAASRGSRALCERCEQSGLLEQSDAHVCASAEKCPQRPPRSVPSSTTSLSLFGTQASSIIGRGAVPYSRRKSRAGKHTPTSVAVAWFSAIPRMKAARARRVDTWLSMNHPDSSSTHSHQQQNHSHTLNPTRSCQSYSHAACGVSLTASATDSVSSSATASSSASCSDSTLCGHSPPIEAPGALGNALRAVAALRQSLEISVAAFAALSIGFLLATAHVGAPVIWKVLLYASLAVTSIPALLESCASLLQRVINVDVLMTMAAMLSVVAGNAFEGALLMALYALSHSAEKRVTEKARGDLDALQELSASTAYRKTPGAPGDGYELVPIDQVCVGDLLLVRTGELAPCDGIVIEGAPYVSMEHITGEAEPRAVERGSEIPAGARTVDGTLTLKVLRTGAESTVSRMIKLVTTAQQNRPQLQGFLDRFGRTYAQLIVCCSLAIALLLPPLARFVLRAHIPYVGPAGSLSRALGFLVTASPCALVIGAPVAYLSTLSACARRGVLVKGGARTVEAIANVRRVVFDKTGTLTTGTPALLGIDCYDEHSDATTNIPRMLSVAAALEDNTVHPIAVAVLNEAAQRGVKPISVRGFGFVSGQGLYAKADLTHAESNEAVYFGRTTFLEEQGSLTEAQKRWMHERAELGESRGESIAVYHSSLGELALFRFQDAPRPDAAAALAAFKATGVRVGMLTGDRAASALRLAQRIGSIDDVWAEKKPEEKLELISSFNTSDGKNSVLYVGDGINDAPALAASTVGASIGHENASATAIHAADVVIMRQRIQDVVWFQRKARAAQRIVVQNVTFALGMMMLASALGVAFSVPLWLCVCLHEGSTVLVGLNGLRLLSDRWSGM
ncbi:putative cadmium/zinc-transporting ATPase HMA1, chloroplastic [Porphyridium purpureum]|uniref:Putative cadmium/zinc-transporting ATPase HMA1, chloroplastic n=1 Tax=Porphyridium purpureum TaxID=35688 RepID=A0A5J4Z050_PORPP|nr:putative cadmium/zinc-transporting ATPase HMA1, chloroplastic [Porphyridium purpureum]|eukprot:POR9499..scf209_3